ncbi:formate transporter FocA, partial [Klebsiella aerogenes]|nr:formate transporter FocA [Klebsiella aerogenes]
MKADSPFNLLSPADMAKVADDACCYKANKHIQTTYLSAFTAGMFISIAFVFYIT